MKRRFVGLSVLALCVISTTGFNPTLGGDTFLTVSCSGSSWSWALEAYSSVGGQTGTIFELGVRSEYSIGCREAGCEDEDFEENTSQGSYVSLTEGNSGFASGFTTFSGQVQTHHWVDADLFQDTHESDDGASDPCGGA